MFHLNMNTCSKRELNCKVQLQFVPNSGQKIYVGIHFRSSLHHPKSSSNCSFNHTHKQGFFGLYEDDIWVVVVVVVVVVAAVVTMVWW
jgi:hypothetical protein